ncbi:hypothetical protein CgunFtcFv8_021209 [Champsocephalus gunnari]|uniref:Uncharacterized protein n=1 Tax=Champsocephalus gunnari TaxID=52237 RepID=A0AAN8E765_CHAGU|nr:hypothetical protein CgunFtcFv8_021209 [Champsocephalus gunnari]
MTNTVSTSSVSSQPDSYLLSQDHLENVDPVPAPPGSFPAPIRELINLVRLPSPVPSTLSGFPGPDPPACSSSNIQ